MQQVPFALLTSEEETSLSDPDDSTYSFDLGILVARSV